MIYVDTGWGCYVFLTGIEAYLLAVVEDLRLACVI